MITFKHSNLSSKVIIITNYLITDLVIKQHWHH